MSADVLTVAVTGPTGDLGRSLLRVLEKTPEVGRVLGMARRPFDPAEQGWTKTEYRRGDVLDAHSVGALVAEADVVVHLAFIIFGGREETRSINLRGSRNVFEATARSRSRRLIYTSSVAAYGFDPRRPHRLTEDMRPEGTSGFYYSAQKAELEALLHEVLDATQVDAYVFRPCIVGGPDALLLVEDIVRQFQVGGRVRRLWPLFRHVPGLRPALPDNGVPFQLVHHDDVAQALVAAILGRGRPGTYNLAADGLVSMREVAGELGWHRFPVPGPVVAGAAGLISRLEFLPTGLAWVNALRVPSLMSTERARDELGWRPRHDARDVLRATIACARQQGLVV